jgi:hypothetical protein
MNRNFYVADPDDFCVSNVRSPDPAWEELKPITFEEAKAAIALSAMAGGMFEDGDDLPALGKESERLALLTNPELLKLMRLSRSATPIDLMTYREKDLQPSVFFIHESNRQGMLAVFNWSESASQHRIALDDLGVSGGRWKAKEIFGADGVAMSDGSVTIAQPSHSVRLIRLLDEGLRPSPPALSIESDDKALVGTGVELRTRLQANGNPLLNYVWDFGDGTSAEGSQITHAFTHKGVFQVSVRAASLDGPAATASRSIEIRGELNSRFSPGVPPVQ